MNVQRSLFHQLPLMGVANGILWGSVACVIGYSPLYHWQGWAIAALAISSFELGKASR